jgi:hypothetical protein
MLFQFSLRDGHWCYGDYFLGLRGVYTVGSTYEDRTTVDIGVTSIPANHLPEKTPCRLGGFNVSNLMGIKRRIIDIGKTITFYFLLNV